MAFKKNKDSDQNTDQENTEVAPVEVDGQNRPANEPADDRGDASRAEDSGQKRVAQNGEVSDPGNSGLIGSDFEGQVEGQADKPNG